jgi:hypothetical protein
MSNKAALPRTLVTLLDGLIDYAGLFPPAGLDMAGALRRFVGYRASLDAWALGRFVLSVARLDEFEAVLPQLSGDASAAQMSGPAPAAEVWREASAAPSVLPLSVLATLPLDRDLARIERFNAEHAHRGAPWQARIECLEVKAATAADMEDASRRAPPDMELFFEVPLDAAADVCMAAASAHRGLKIRTGATTIDGFPPSAAVARFLGACAVARVPFKATAGLHHPIRSAHPITYAPGAPSATMHGFLNLFVAATLLFAGKADVATATRVLEDELAAGFRFDDEGLAWRETRIDIAQVTAARAFARSFGSCSFEEPLAELATLPSAALPFRARSS